MSPFITLLFISILLIIVFQYNSASFLFELVCKIIKPIVLFPAEISTLITGESTSGTMVESTLELCFDFANWINVDIVTLFHR